MLSRPATSEDYCEARNEWTLDTALAPLETEFGQLDSLVRDARVLDFGCGAGWQSVALAARGARHVLGLDINERSLGHARQLAQHSQFSNVEFATAIPAAQHGTFDLVITQNAMEHFENPAAVLALMASALRPGGRILVSFGPPWLAPTGSHMHFFTRVPWVNVLFSERTVMAVRARYRSDGALRYEDVESGLNRMTVGRFERLTAQCRLKIQERRYRCAKGLNFLQYVPGVRELFINNVSCVLLKP